MKITTDLFVSRVESEGMGYAEVTLRELPVRSFDEAFTRIREVTLMMPTEDAPIAGARVQVTILEGDDRAVLERASEGDRPTSEVG